MTRIIKRVQVVAEIILFAPLRPPDYRASVCPPLRGHWNWRAVYTLTLPLPRPPSPLHSGASGSHVYLRLNALYELLTAEKRTARQTGGRHD